MTVSGSAVLAVVTALTALVTIVALVSTSRSSPAAPVAAPEAWTNPVVDPAAFAVTAPRPFRGATVRPSLLVYSEAPLRRRALSRVEQLPGVRAAVPLSLGALAVQGRTVMVAAVPPASLRRLTAPEVARADDVWARVAGGEAAVDPDLRPAVSGGDGYLALGDDPGAPRVHVGAFATLPPLIDVVVNERWASALGMPQGNAVLVATRSTTDTGTLVRQVRRAAGGAVAVRRLDAVGAQPSGPQTGYLTGGAVAAAVGSFTYVPRPDGTVSVDPGWIAANIRTEQVPILGTVTCHRVMLLQLRGALQEVVDRGLAGSIRPGEYGGCFYPRYIGHDPAKGLSLHSWGIAVDLNVPGNLRGTVGEIDREVVQIFKRWGFAWGGDWAWTDPMHFELAALVRVG